MEYIQIGEAFISAMNRNAHGHVLNLTSKSIYLQLDDESLLLICSVRFGYIPFAMLLDDNDLHKLKSQLSEIGNQEFYLDSKGIYFGSIHIPLTPMIKEGNVVLNAIVEERFTRFSIAFHNYSLQGCENALEQLIGLGDGLTPSGDDMLVGFLYAAKRLEANREFLSKVIETVLIIANKQTSSVSLQYIRSVCEGYYFELLDILFLSHINHQNVDFHTQRMQIVGNSSGPFMAKGMSSYFNN